MRRVDLIAKEQHMAATYRREAVNRAKRYPKVAARLTEWAEASERRAEEMRCGPLFNAGEEG